MAFLAHDSFYNSTFSCPLYGTQNDTVINQNLTTGVEFLEVTIQLRKSESIKGLPNHKFQTDNLPKISLGYP